MGVQPEINILLLYFIIYCLFQIYRNMLETFSKTCLHEFEVHRAYF